MIEIAPLTAITKQTVPDLQSLSEELHKGGGTPEVTKERVEEVLADANAILMVAKDGEQIAGMASLYVLPKTAMRIAHIDDVVVGSAYRGQGLGEKLMHALIDEARARGVKQVELTSRPARVAAQGLYQKIGFVKRETDAFRLTL